MKRLESFFKDKTKGSFESQNSVEADNPAFELSDLKVTNESLKKKSIDFQTLDANLQNLTDEEFIQIENCPSMASTFETFITLISSFLMKISTALGVFIKLHGEISFLSDRQFFRMLDMLKNFSRSFLIAYETSEDNSCVIYWRLEGVEQIFCIPIGGNEANVGNFVADFLMNSLRNGHSGLHKFFEFDKEKLNIKTSVNLLSDSRGYNFLHLAAEAGKTAIVKILLNLNFDVNFKADDGKIAADLAYNGKHFEILLMLLKENSKYPSNFTDHDLPNDLKNFLQMSENLHASVKFDDQMKVKEILEQNQNLRHFYDSKNISAVAASMLSKSFEIYKLLIGKNIFLGAHESFQDIVEELSDDDRRALRKCHDQHTQGFMEDHIMILMGNSSVGPDEPDNQSKLSYALKAFQKINKIPQVSLILQIVSAMKFFKITFDFQRDDVQYLDPSSEPYTNGLFYLTGMIYIAAANLLDDKKFHEVCGTIAHELCHFVMFKLFNNLAKPYDENDQERLNDFAQILNNCEELKNRETIIQLVYECYDEPQQHAELIVRVPHILAHYQNEPQKLEELHTVFKPLFDFFNHRCMPEMEAALPKFIEEGKKTKNEVKQKKQIKVLLWSLLALLMIGSVATFTIYQIYKPDSIYDCKNLTQILKDQLMNRNVNFQGEQIRFKDLLEPNSNALCALSTQQIRTLIDGKLFKISEPIETKVDFFIERKFQDESKKIYTKEEIYENNKNQDILLSDFPGAGKTTTFKYLAIILKKKNPNQWVSYIDLKKYTKEYKIFEENLKIMSRETVQNFIAQNILKLSKFDAEIFMKSYENSNVTFLWDGVDEITPTFDDFIINFIKFIKHDTKNQHLISTRTFLQNRLKKLLNLEVFRLYPFEPQDRIEFVTKFMEHRGENSSTIEKELKKIQPFFDKILNRTCDEDNPLMLNMICTIYFDQAESLANADSLSVYKNFIRLKFKLISEKGEVVDDGRVDTELEQHSISQVHQFYAIKLIFGNKSGLKSLSLLQSQPEFKNQQIARFGILEVDDDGNFNFIHRTFAEYFCAQFIIENIYKVKFYSGREEFEARLAIISLIVNDIYRGYKVVTNFIEDFIKSDESKIVDKPDRKIIEAVQKDVEATRLLNILIYHRYNKNSVLGYFEFLSKFWRKNYEILRIYWHVDDDENVFHFLVKELRLWKIENKSWLVKFTKLVQKHLNQDDSDILIPSDKKNPKNSGIWIYYIWRERNGPQQLRKRDVEYSIKNYSPSPKPEIHREIIAEWALSEEIEKLLDIENVVEFLEVLRTILPIDSVKKILICEFAEISITLNDENLENFWALTEEILSPDEMKRALIKHDFYNGAAIHNPGDFSPEHFQKLLEFYQKFLIHEEIKDLLITHNSLGSIPLVSVLNKGDDFHLDLLLNFTTKYFKSQKDVKKLLRHESYFGSRIPLSFAFVSKHKFNTMVRVYQKVFSKNEIEEMILTSNQRENYNYLHLYVRNIDEHLEVMEFLKNNVKNINSTLKQLLVERDKRGETFFSIGVKYNKMFITDEFKPIANEIFNPEELKSLQESNEEKSLSLNYGDVPAPSCKYVPEIPDSLEKYEEIIRAIGLDRILENWVQNSPEQLSKFISSLNLDEIDKIFSNLGHEQFEKAAKLINSIGIDNILKLDAESLSKFLLLLRKVDLNELLSKIDENVLNTFSALIGVSGLKKVIALLTPEFLENLLG